MQAQFERRKILLVDLDAFWSAILAAPLTASQADPILSAVLGIEKSEQAGSEFEPDQKK